MEKSIAVIGWDLRIVKLIQMLVNDGFKVSTFGLEMSEDLAEIDSIEMCPTLQEAVKNCKVVVGPIPLTSDRKNLSMPFSNNKLEIEEFCREIRGKTLIAGNIPEVLKSELDEFEISSIDLFKREEFIVLNNIATAEGTIHIAMEETGRTLHGSNVLVMGFGRVGKVLSKMLDGIGTKVFCEARKDEDIAWIKAY